MSVKSLIKDVKSGNRRALAKAITLCESSTDADREVRAELIDAIWPNRGSAIKVAISGPPGVGKSSLIEVLGLHILSKSYKVAVLAVDPSSPTSGGSILGDKTRMEKLSAHENAFIRPSPAGLTLGGVAHGTRDAMLLCEAAGFDVIILETVGVGQSEYDASSMVDVFTLLHLPNSGDDLQGIKRGILEVADVIAITKADGDNTPHVDLARQQLEASIRLRFDGTTWVPPVIATSGVTGHGVDDLWRIMCKFIATQQESGGFQKRRDVQGVEWFLSESAEATRALLRTNQSKRGLVAKLTKEVATGNASPVGAASLLMAKIKKSLS